MSFAPLTPEQKRRVATRLSGTAVAALKLGAGLKVVSMSMYAQGPLTGKCELTPAQPARIATKEGRLADLYVTLAGRAAQEVICQVDAPLSGVNLTRARQTAEALSSRYAVTGTVDDIVSAAYDFVKSFIDAQRSVVVKLTEALMRRGELTGGEIEKLVNGD